MRLFDNGFKRQGAVAGVQAAATYYFNSIFIGTTIALKFAQCIQQNPEEKETFSRAVIFSSASALVLALDTNMVATLLIFICAAQCVIGEALGWLEDLRSRAPQHPQNQ